MILGIAIAPPVMSSKIPKQLELSITGNIWNIYTKIIQLSLIENKTLLQVTILVNDRSLLMPSQREQRPNNKTNTHMSSA